jgi:nitrogenase molybdenum-iron protein NifN
MAEILGRSKALAVNPLKTSQPLGASLAVLGLNRAMPLLHGAQGCTAFAKVFLVRHFGNRFRYKAPRWIRSAASWVRTIT